MVNLIPMEGSLKNFLDEINHYPSSFFFFPALFLLLPCLSLLSERTQNTIRQVLLPIMTMADKLIYLRLSSS